MEKYCMKPIGAIEAIHHDSVSALSAERAAEFCGGSFKHYEADHGSYVVVPHPNGGATRADVGDWVVRIDGAFYACPADVFAAIFESPSPVASETEGRDGN